MAEASIWRNKEYLKFFSSFTIGNIGDWFDFFALQIIFAHNFNASPLAISLLMIVYMLPNVLFGAFAGMIVDRFNQKWLMFFTDFICGFITLALVFSNGVVMALALVFLRSTIASINSPAQQVAIKHLVTEKQLLKASSYGSLSFQVCRIIGPLIGALVITVSSPKACLAINAVSFWVSALILLFLHLKPHIDEEAHELVGSWWARLKQTQRVVLDNPLLKCMIGLMLLAFLFVMMAETQLVIILKHLVPSQPHILGYVIGVSAIGSTITGVWLSRKDDIQSFVPYLLLAFSTSAVGYGVMAIYQASWPLLIIYIAALIQGVGFAAVIILYQYALQRELAANIMGRVNGVLSMLSSAVLMLGAFGGGLLIMAVGVRTAYLMAALGLVVCLVLVVFWRARLVSSEQG